MTNRGQGVTYCVIALLRLRILEIYVTPKDLSFPARCQREEITEPD